MKNFKELGSKKKKFLISAGGILVITLIVILAATGLPKDGDSKADKVIQGNQDIQASDEAQTDDENKNAAEAAADDGKIHTLKSLLFAVPKLAARPRLLRADHLAQALVRAAAKTTSQPVSPLLTDMSGLTM